MNGSFVQYEMLDPNGLELSPAGALQLRLLVNLWNRGTPWRREDEAAGMGASRIFAILREERGQPPWG